MKFNQKAYVCIFKSINNIDFDKFLLCCQIFSTEIFFLNKSTLFHNFLKLQPNLKKKHLNSIIHFIFIKFLKCHNFFLFLVNLHQSKILFKV